MDATVCVEKRQHLAQRAVGFGGGVRARGMHQSGRGGNDSQHNQAH
jgi:hypothetical protein